MAGKGEAKTSAICTWRRVMPDHIHYEFCSEPATMTLVDHAIQKAHHADQRTLHVCAKHLDVMVDYVRWRADYAAGRIRQTLGVVHVNNLLKETHGA